MRYLFNVRRQALTSIDTSLPAPSHLSNELIQFLLAEDSLRIALHVVLRNLGDDRLTHDVTDAGRSSGERGPSLLHLNRLWWRRRAFRKMLRDRHLGRHDIDFSGRSRVRMADHVVGRLHVRIRAVGLADRVGVGQSLGVWSWLTLRHCRIGGTGRTRHGGLW